MHTCCKQVAKGLEKSWRNSAGACSSCVGASGAHQLLQVADTCVNRCDSCKGLPRCGADVDGQRRLTTIAAVLNSSNQQCRRCFIQEELHHFSGLFVIVGLDHVKYPAHVVCPVALLGLGWCLLPQIQNFLRYDDAVCQDLFNSSFQHLGFEDFACWIAIAPFPLMVIVEAQLGAKVTLRPALRAAVGDAVDGYHVCQKRHRLRCSGYQLGCFGCAGLS